MHLSIVVPAYNESKVLKSNLLETVKYLSKKKYKWEIIVVDDGSADGTYDIAAGLHKFGINAYKLQQNQGKGGALKEGFAKASGDYIIFTDADLSVPLLNIDRFLKELKTFDVVIGSRRVEGADIIVHQPLVREYMGKVFTWITRLITDTNLADYTCGFKGFSKDASKKIFKYALIKRWSYDSEIMFLAHKFRFKVKQYPVKWFNREDSRVRLSDAVFTSFWDLLKIRVYDLLGKYA